MLLDAVLELYETRLELVVAIVLPFAAVVLPFAAVVFAFVIGVVAPFVFAVAFAFVAGVVFINAIVSLSFFGFVVGWIDLDPDVTAGACEEGKDGQGPKAGGDWLALHGLNVTQGRLCRHRAVDPFLTDSCTLPYVGQSTRHDLECGWDRPAIQQVVDRRASTRALVMVLTLFACRMRAIEADEPAKGQDCMARAKAAEAKGESWRATSILREGCDGGDNLACCERAAQAMLGSSPLAHVLGVLESMCDRDHIDGCLRAGDILATVAPLDASAYYVRACQDAYGEFQGCGRRGAGVCAVEIAHEPEVCRQAVARLAAMGEGELARKAAYAVCQSTETTGCALLGEFLASGVGREGLPDLEAAVEVVRRACRSGDDEACTRADEFQQQLDERDRAARCDDVPEELRTSTLTKADVHIGPFDASGVAFCSMACRVPGEDGGFDALLIGPLAATAMSEHRSELAECGEEGLAIRLSWEVRDGRMSEVDAVGEGPLSACVEEALRDVATPFVGECVATMRIPRGVGPQ